jgi:hypothetical protein
MADRINGYVVNCIGGLDTNKDLLSQGRDSPGSATQLVNYEPATIGGYRRISGYANEYGTVPGQDSVLGVFVCEDINDGIFACRKPSSGTAYFHRWVNSTSSWSAITTPVTVTMNGVNKVRFLRYNWSSVKMAIVDGINPAAIYNGTTYTQITHANAPNSPKYVASFKNHLFLAGDTTDPFNLYFSSPLNEVDFSPANGAGVINVGFEIVQIKTFRDTLYIFGKNAIKSLAGTNISDFVVAEVTSNLGCVIPDSVIELGGNLLFVGPDGFRPVAGTNKIGDVELETISKKIQFSINVLLNEMIVEGINPETLSTVVLRKKSQFRLFLPTQGTLGILGGLRQSQQGIEFEYSQLFDFSVTCAASGYIGIDEIVIHGDTNGKVHQQEVGTSFDGNDILSIYQTPYLYFDDPTVRKNFYNVSTFLRSEGPTNITLAISYDFDDSVGVFNPSNYDITTSGAAAYYNEATYDAAATYDGNPSPVEKTNISGSGFSISYKYVTNNTSASHTIQGLVLNYATNDRR